jgi:hypothetical protein
MSLTRRDVAMVNNADLHALTAHIDETGRAQHAASYAGIEIDESRAIATVYRVPDPGLDDFLAREAPGVRVIDADHGLQELTLWHDHVVDDLTAWAENGVTISTVVARHDGSGVEVGTPDPGRARHEMLRRYGVKAPLIFTARPRPTLVVGSGVTASKAAGPAVARSLFAGSGD